MKLYESEAARDPRAAFAREADLLDLSQRLEGILRKRKSSETTWKRKGAAEKG